MPETEYRWIEFETTIRERAVLESAFTFLDQSEVEYHDLTNSDTFVYAGNPFALKQALTNVAKHHGDPTAREVRMRIRDIQREQQQARDGEAV